MEAVIPQGPDGQPMTPVLTGVYRYSKPEGGYIFAVSLSGPSNLPYISAWEQSEATPIPELAAYRFKHALECMLSNEAM